MGTSASRCDPGPEVWGWWRAPRLVRLVHFIPRRGPEAEQWWRDRSRGAGRQRRLRRPTGLHFQTYCTNTPTLDLMGVSKLDCWEKMPLTYKVKKDEKVSKLLYSFTGFWQKDVSKLSYKSKVFLSFLSASVQPSSPGESGSCGDPALHLQRGFLV